MQRLVLTTVLALFMGACGLRETPPTPTPTAPLPVAEATTTTGLPVATTPAATVEAGPEDPAAPLNAVIEELVETVQPRRLETWASPDGARRAEVVRYDCTEIGAEGQVAYEQLKIIDVAAGSEEVVDRQLQNCGGLGAAGLGSLYWSPEGRFFYYTTARQGVPDGCGFWDRPVNRVSVESLQVELLGAGPRSPDGAKLATWQENELLVWDVSGGELLRLPAAAPDLLRGPIAWAPDSQSLAYVQVGSFCPLSGVSAVVYVDLAAGTQEQLLESESPTFGSVTWASQDTLILLDETGAEWRYQLGSEGPVRDE